jgi:VanZ family protein
LKKADKLRTAYIIYILLLILVSLVPGNGHSSPWHIDKIGHFMAYAGMAVLTMVNFNSRVPRMAGIGFGVLLGGFLEWGQSFVPGRDMSMLDEIANTLGLLAGIFIYHVWGESLSERVQRLIS